jgi:hypothetical protein
VYFALEPMDVTGSQAEGGGAGLSPRGVKVLGLHVGAAVPTVGTKVLGSRVDSTWVFEVPV